MIISLAFFLKKKILNPPKRMQSDVNYLQEEHEQTPCKVLVTKLDLRGIRFLRVSVHLS